MTDRLFGRHRAPSIPDLLIAAAAELAELAVLHLDEDFELIADLRSSNRTTRPRLSHEPVAGEQRPSSRADVQEVRPGTPTRSDVPACGVDWADGVEPDELRAVDTEASRAIAELAEQRDELDAPLVQVVVRQASRSRTLAPMRRTAPR